MNPMNQFICDTCEQPDPQWLYHTTHFRPRPDSKYVIGGWAACDTCRALFDARDAEGFSRPATAVLAEPGEEDFVYDRSLKLYRALLDHIEGAAEPFTAQESAAIAAQDTRV